MKISELKKYFSDIDILNDANISSFGFLESTYGDANLVYIEDVKYINKLKGNTSAVITTHEIAKHIDDNLGIIACEQPKKMFYKIHNYLAKNTNFYGDDFDSIIDSSARVHPMAYVAPKNVKIAAGTIIDAMACINEGSVIGENCYLGNNTTIAGRGFQYYTSGNEALYMEHIGQVIIGDSVEILSNTNVVRGLISPTIIGNHTKIDALCHIAHGCTLGERVLVVAGTSMVGSAVVKDRARLSINSTIGAVKTIGEDAFVSAGAVAIRDVKPGTQVSGNFAIEHKKLLKNMLEISK